MNAQSLLNSTQELSFGFFAEWLKRQMQRFTRKTPVVVPVPEISLNFEEFRGFVEGSIEAPMFFQEDPLGFYAQGNGFSVELEDGVMRCYLWNKEVSFRFLIASLEVNHG